MAINTELLARVRDHILEEPRRYNQRIWGGPSSEAPCGTAACLAGWAAHLSGKVPLEELKGIGFDRDNIICATARDALGLSQQEAVWLFDSPPYVLWPRPFGERFDEAYKAGDKEAQARAAADYIDHIIATGKVTD